jgi:hypothetical protein
LLFEDPLLDQPVILLDRVTARRVEREWAGLEMSDHASILCQEVITGIKRLPPFVGGRPGHAPVLPGEGERCANGPAVAHRAKMDDSSERSLLSRIDTYLPPAERGRAAREPGR